MSMDDHESRFWLWVAVMAMLGIESCIIAIALVGMRCR